MEVEAVVDVLRRDSRSAASFLDVEDVCEVGTHAHGDRRGDGSMPGRPELELVAQPAVERAPAEEERGTLEALGVTRTVDDDRRER